MTSNPSLIHHHRYSLVVVLVVLPTYLPTYLSTGTLYGVFQHSFQAVRNHFKTLHRPFLTAGFSVVSPMINRARVALLNEVIVRPQATSALHNSSHYCGFPALHASLFRIASCICGGQQKAKPLQESTQYPGPGPGPGPVNNACRFPPKNIRLEIPGRLSGPSNLSITSTCPFTAIIIISASNSASHIFQQA